MFKTINENDFCEITIVNENENPLKLNINKSYNRELERIKNNGDTKGEKSFKSLGDFKNKYQGFYYIWKSKIYRWAIILIIIMVIIAIIIAVYSQTAQTEKEFNSLLHVSILMIFILITILIIAISIVSFLFSYLSYRKLIKELNRRDKICSDKQLHLDKKSYLDRNNIKQYWIWDYYIKMNHPI